MTAEHGSRTGDNSRGPDGFLDGCLPVWKKGAAWDHKITGTEAEGFGPWNEPALPLAG